MKKSGDKRSLVVRIVAIVMAALMVLGICTILFQTVLAADTIPVTGSDPKAKLPIFILIAAVVLVALCVLLPTMKKKNK